jgi:SAM-dependent methyltransferase
MGKKQYGIIGSIKKIKYHLVNNHIKDFNSIKKYFLQKNGLEIGGPSGAFMDQGYIPVYKFMKALDGVNFSNNTVWTGNMGSGGKFIINERIVGKMYITDTIDLGIIENCNYDFVLSSNNIEHIANPMKAMEQWILKIKEGGILVVVAPKKEVNFDHKREVVKFTHLQDDYEKNTNEHDLTHLEEILKLHDLSRDPPAGTFEQFKERSLKNYENRCLHHHVFDLMVLEKMCKYFNLEIFLKEETVNDYIVIAKK